MDKSLKKITFIFFLCLLLNWSVHSQEYNLNQTKPLSGKPGRLIKLKETFRISDSKGGFFFRYPKRMNIDANGDIFLMDYNQLLRFNRKGEMLNNYHREGQGPGELIAMKNYILYGDYIILCGNRPNKIIWFERNGTLRKEFRIYKNYFSLKLISYRNNKYYFIYSTIPKIKTRKALVDAPNKIIEISADGKDVRYLTSFPVRTFVVNYGGGRSSQGMCSFITSVHKDRYLVLNHTSEYLIKIYDLEKNQILKTFSRRYERIEAEDKPDDNSIVVGTQKSEEVKQKYVQDIKDIITVKDKIWVVTSTENNKGTLIDLFDYAGNYLDNFYLKLKGEILAVHDYHIFCRERDDNDNPIIVKYHLNK